LHLSASTPGENSHHTNQQKVAVNMAHMRSFCAVKICLILLALP
jgi:hypothetical protein